LPPLEAHVLIEYSHRTAASLASVLVVLTVARAWTRWRRRPDVARWATVALVLLVVQVLLGAVTVVFELPPAIVLAHLAVAMGLLGALCVTATAVSLPASVPATVDHGTEGPGSKARVRGPGKGVFRERAPARDVQGARSVRGGLKLARAAAGGTFLLMLSGSLVTGTGASGACDAWPLCGGGLSFSFEKLPLIQLLHRGLAALVGLLVVWSLVVLLRRYAQHRGVRATVALTLTALVLQVAVGAAVVRLELPPVLRGLHLALAAAVWAGTVVLSVLARHLPSLPVSMESQASPASRARRPAVEVLLDYLSLAKPRIIVLLLITALGGMMIASRGWPSTGLVLLTLLGGALAAAGASAINCWIDRDLDREMLRTRRRPLPDGRIVPSHALVFGILLGVTAFVVLAFWVNVLAATLAISGLLFYVLVYTLWLKRSTPQNIVIGGAAGAVPPLVGWAAVTHGLDLTAIYLFAIIFFWTPPHFWALAIQLRADYARARIPMLPVVKGDREARRQILWYTLILVALSLLMFTTRSVGRIYLVGAVLLGTAFIVFALLNLGDRGRRWVRPLFGYSIAYLALLFTLMMVDSVVT